MNRLIELSRALRLLLIAAVLGQAFLVQTHVHYARVAAPTQFSVTQPNGHPAKSIGQTDDPDHCPLCWEAAMAGHYFAPRVAVVPPAPVVLFWLVGSVTTAFDLAQPPHGWLSRAPPR